MLRFILRRLVVSVFVLLGALFIVYNLTAISKNPLQDIIESTAPNKAELIAARTQLLDLDVPPPARFFIWLGGILGAFVPRFDDPNGLFGFLGSNLDWGVNVVGQDVGPIIGAAVQQTLQLVTAATLLAIVIGVAVGISTALRQYSGYDYTVTFLAFLTYSLPIFFIAVLLKQYVAIGFNDFLQDPEIPIPMLVLIGVVAGFIAMAVAGGPIRTRLLIFGGFAVATIAILALMQATDWFRNPGLGTPLIIIIGLIVAAIAAALSVGIRHRRNLLITAGIAIVGGLLWWPLYGVMSDTIGPWFPWALVIGCTLAGWLAGRLLGGVDARAIAANGAITGFAVGALLIIDRVMQGFHGYYQLTNGRPISTVGAQSPQLGASPSIWLQLLDGFSHLLLPTIAIMLISIASYSRYSRASLLETMSQDYIRTARAKGLPERTVIMRHALRNALIPVTTIVATDVGAIIGGAIVTEQIFAWRAMGSIFSDSLHNVDLNPLMAYMLVTATMTILFNLVADLLYSSLDPRIRLGE